MKREGSGGRCLLIPPVSKTADLLDAWSSLRDYKQIGSMESAFDLWLNCSATEQVLKRVTFLETELVLQRCIHVRAKL